jgi:hypothetical protein
MFIDVGCQEHVGIGALGKSRSRLTENAVDKNSSAYSAGKNAMRPMSTNVLGAAAKIVS